MELTAPTCQVALKSASMLTALTRSWQSSKTPSTATLTMFSSRRENIWARWNAVMRPAGVSMTTERPRRPRSAYSAEEPGVTGGGTDDGEPVATAGELVFEELTQELHRHVLEGCRGAVREVGEVQAGALQGVNGDNLGVREGGGAVGAGGDRAQVVGGDVVDEERDDACGHGRVAVLTQDDAQLIQIGLRQRRGTPRAGRGRRQGRGLPGGCH